MKKVTVLLLSLLLLTAVFSSSAQSVCTTTGGTWVAAWTDPYGQTTYSLEAPCVAYVGVPFNITATVSDSVYPNSNVGASWSILDNQLAIASGFWITTANGIWQKVQQQSYSDDTMQHTIDFKYIDLGQGSGAHYWTRNSIGDVTVVARPLNNPPVANAGIDRVLSRESQQQTVLLGTATDADDNALTYRWLEGATELQGWQSADAFGNAPLNLASLPPLALGSHILTLQVSDGTATAADEVAVVIENTPPVAAPFAGGTYQVGQDIRLNGSVADYDGDLLTYKWFEGTTVLAEGTVPSPAGGAPVLLPEHAVPGGLALGSHTLTLQVSDGINTVVATTSVIVIDTAAPSITPVASDMILWPPNSTMRTVTIDTHAYDNSGESVMLSVLITSNEPAETDKDGNIIPDFSVANIDQATGVITLQLRAARQGNGGGRTYSVTITAVDGSGNSSSTEVLIRAPHDMARQ